MSVVTIIGSGMMGASIGLPASHNGAEVRLVGTHLDRFIIDECRKNSYHCTLKRELNANYIYYHIEELEEAVSGADVIVSGVSSFGVDWFMNEIIPKLPKGTPILSVTKGMVNRGISLLPYQYIYSEKYPDRMRDFYAVGGPCTSYELADKDPTEVCFCGPDLDTLKKIKDIFATDYYNISLSTDVIGVECAVAMKNAYALAVSLAVGLAHKKEGADAVHYNSQAALFTQSVKEMSKLLAMTGGAPENICWGAGDLYVTIFGGRTRKIGTLLGEGLSFDDAMKKLDGVTLESIVISDRTAKAVKERIKTGIANENEFPLLLLVDGIINENKPAEIPWKKLESVVTS